MSSPVPLRNVMLLKPAAHDARFPAGLRILINYYKFRVLFGSISVIY